MHSDNNLNKITNITNSNTIVGYDKFQLIDTFINTFTGSLEFYSRLNSSFIEDLVDIHTYKEELQCK
jgi:hypothetical protein